MTWLTACLAGLSVYFVVVPARRASIAVSLESYLSPRRDEEERSRWSLAVPAAGVFAAIGGAFVGLLVAQGDLFLSGGTRSGPAMAGLGAGAGWVLWSMRRTTLRERRARRLRFELPVVADAMSLHVIAGESIIVSIRSVVEEFQGIASQELRTVTCAHDAGEGLPAALAEASRATAHPDARRLYDTLSHAHATGGRVADALGDLAVDYRAALSRDLTAEGGRRAIITYGPVLVLMVPTALVFLIYPTLLGLRTLAGAP